MANRREIAPTADLLRGDPNRTLAALDVAGEIRLLGSEHESLAEKVITHSAQLDGLFGNLTSTVPRRLPGISSYVTDQPIRPRASLISIVQGTTQHDVRTSPILMRADILNYELPQHMANVAPEDLGVIQARVRAEVVCTDANATVTITPTQYPDLEAMYHYPRASVNRLLPLVLYALGEFTGHQIRVTSNSAQALNGINVSVAATGVRRSHTST